MLIQACLNGSRAPGAHPRLPLHPPELAEAAARCAEAGAGALHIHPRAADGTQSLDPAVQEAAVAAIRARCPALPLGVSTAAWIEPDPARRLALVRQSRTLPDYASVNLAETGAVELCRELLSRGIGIEPTYCQSHHGISQTRESNQSGALIALSPAGCFQCPHTWTYARILSNSPKQSLCDTLLVRASGGLSE